MEQSLFQNELQVELKEQGVDFVYFVDISHLTVKQNKGYSTSVLIGIVLSKAYLKKVALNPFYVEQMKTSKAQKNDEFYLTELKTNNIADYLEKYIISKGFKAYSQSEENILKTGFYDKESRTTPLPHKTIAGFAGLGWIGKHNLLVTKEYGSAISICSILTNAPLKTKRQEPITPHCGNCNICKEICKTNAIKGKNWECDIEREKIVDVFACTTCFQCVVQCPWTKGYINRNG